MRRRERTVRGRARAARAAWATVRPRAGDGPRREELRGTVWEAVGKRGENRWPRRGAGGLGGEARERELRQGPCGDLGVPGRPARQNVWQSEELGRSV